MCSSISGKYVSTTKQIVFTGKNVFPLVRNMFPTTGKSRISRQKYGFPLVGNVSITGKIVLLAKISTATSRKNASITAKNKIYSLNMFPPVENIFLPQGK